jgi:hypothetical protein
VLCYIFELPNYALLHCRNIREIEILLARLQNFQKYQLKQAIVADYFSKPQEDSHWLFF